MIILIIPVLFFLAGVKTLSDYGVNWDETQHFNRGHAYLYYVLTGKTNYLGLPVHQSLDEAVDFKDIRGKYMDIYDQTRRSYKLPDENFRRSYFQSDVFNFEYFIKNDSGHPPLNGILAATSNYIFYQKLGILSDLSSHHIFEIFVSFLIVLGVAVFSFYLFGVFPSIIASASLSLYPLFLGESHFNIKDPVSASFFGLTIITVYFGVVKKNKWLVFLSSIFAGLCLGTKFNAVFLPLIIIPWLLLYFWKVTGFKMEKDTRDTLVSSIFIPFIIFYITWPYLWFNGWKGIQKILVYYATEGIGTPAVLSDYILFGFNFFPLTWIFYTTPVPILILTGIGVFWLVKKLIKEKDHTSFLMLAWLLIPVLRVTMPDTAIYGGVRHIMEFIPALALTSGAGVYALLKIIRRPFQRFVKLLIVLSIIFVFFEMIKIHPNENVYFNQFSEGLSGAKERNIPYWGNSFGNAYQQGIEWLNGNVPENARLGLPIGGTVNLPKMNIRADIQLSNDYYSGFSRNGEYQIEMSHDGIPKEMFTYAYLDNFLNPVYEVKVDGVAILKIWKNDLSHTKKGFEKEKDIKVKNVQVNAEEILVNLEEITSLTRIYISHDKSDCSKINDGFISTSLDGDKWHRESDPLTYPQMSPKKIGAENTNFFFLFPGRSAKVIKINAGNKNACLLVNPQIKVRGLY